MVELDICFKIDLRAKELTEGVPGDGVVDNYRNTYLKELKKNIAYLFGKSKDLQV